MTTAISSCAQCRTVLLPGQSRCLVCGVDSGGPSSACPTCGHRVPRPARFCTRCGNELREPAPPGAGEAVPPRPQTAAPRPQTVAPRGQAQAQPELALAEVAAVRRQAGTPAESLTEADFVKVRNPGTRFYLTVGGTVGLLLALVSIHSFVAATFFTPQRAVTGYLDALAARDARKALSYLDPSQGDGVLLTDEVLKDTGYRPPENITVGDVPAEGDRRVVPVGFELDGRSYSLTVFARRADDRTLGVFRGWVVEGGLLPLQLTATGGARPVVNGVIVPRNGSGPLAVFPGRYRVAIADNPVLQARETVAVVAGQTGAVRLSPSLKDSARSEIEATVKSYVDDCARSDQLRPTGCPFAVTAPSSVSGVRWTIASYPALNLSVDPETGAVNVATGREGRADATGTASDGTPFARSDGFRVTGSAAFVDGRLSFTAR